LAKVENIAEFGDEFGEVIWQLLPKVQSRFSQHILRGRYATCDECGLRGFFLHGKLVQLVTA
jgi:hypothetical protein